MRPLFKEQPKSGLTNAVKAWLDEHPGSRLGLLTSIDGQQLVTLVLDPKKSHAECWLTDLEGSSSYHSLTALIPQSHWFERAVYDLFGLLPVNHPRFKHLLLHDEYHPSFHPLKRQSSKEGDEQLPKELIQSTDVISAADSLSAGVPALPGAKREYEFMQVKGEGIYELPVGPIHAGVIEPGHFRFSCFGETILNLEIRLGYSHRGVEKRLTEVPWQNARFVAEAAASDTACANALAHAIAIESLFEITVPPLAQSLRTLALEIERLAVHIVDIGGLSADFGFLSIAASAGRLRGKALGLAQTLSGSRFLRGYIIPGGVRKCSYAAVSTMQARLKELRTEIRTILEILKENLVARERVEKVGIISSSLAKEFGFVGITARACGIAYDCRQYFSHGRYPELAPPIVTQNGGDILARSRVRAGEIESSCNVIQQILDQLSDGPCFVDLPEVLPANQIGLAIVEAFRGELVHLVFTDDQGKIKRYAIKDPSFNNWTAVSIAIRNGLIADFPLCNKSLALSYSGNDL